MSTFGRHDREGANRADRSCLALCLVPYKSVPPGTGDGATKAELC
jgi:hypothetical protein